MGQTDLVTHALDAICAQGEGRGRLVGQTDLVTHALNAICAQGGGDWTESSLEV